jgi:hypothetical protein
VSSTKALAKLLSLEVRIPAGNGLAIVAEVVDAAIKYGQVRVLVKGAAAEGTGTVTAWVDAARCQFATANGVVPGWKLLNMIEEGVA